MKRHLCLLLTLLLLFGCSNSTTTNPSEPTPTPHQPTFSNEQLLSFTTVGFDKGGPGDFGYKVLLNESEKSEFISLMQTESWQTLEKLPEYGLSTVLQIADDSLHNILYVSDGGELGTVIVIAARQWDDKQIFYAPADVVKSAKGFSDTLKYTYIKVKADNTRSAEQTIAAYFDAHYRSYIAMQDIDISELLDMEVKSNQNLITWLGMLNQRRRLLYENSLCYVETEPFDYEIVYDSEAEDDRMKFWQRRMDEEFDAVYHFRIRGEQGKAYPPTFALNSQHTILLKKTDNGWKIVRHYYPGAVRNFYQNDGLEIPDDQTALAQLKEEFAFAEQPEPVEVPENALNYDAEKAVAYANRYAEQPNPIYYNVLDWNGNCQNFVSQSVSSGFGYDGNPDPMTRKWFAGIGGGTSQWENCDYFWDYAVVNKGIGGIELQSVAQLIPGDMLQLRSLGRNDPDDFSHVIFLVDDQKLVFAQNSPPNFVYYSDLVNIASRYFRPVYLSNHIKP